MQRRWLPITMSVVALSAMVSFSGCRGRGLLPPAGPLNQQQATAIIHDPFPQEDIAPSDSSVRPPSYQRPLAEPVRNRLVPDAMPHLGR